MKVLLVGHVSKDLFGTETRIGGPPTYQAPIFLELGYEVFVLTSSHPNFPFLVHPRLRIHNVESEATTTFSFSTNEDGTRRLKLVKKAKDLPEKVPFNETFDLAIISPICGEVNSPLLKSIRSKAKLCIGDVQGFIRHISEDGLVSHREFLDFNLLENYFDIMKGSNEEMSNLPMLKKLTFILTQGSGPVKVISPTKSFEIPITKIPEEKIVDSTGSGDLFLAGFAHEYVNGYDFAKAVEFGNKVAISNLFKTGPPSLKS